MSMYLLPSDRREWEEEMVHKPPPYRRIRQGDSVARAQMLLDRERWFCAMTGRSSWTYEKKEYTGAVKSWRKLFGQSLWKGRHASEFCLGRVDWACNASNVGHLHNGLMCCHCYALLLPCECIDSDRVDSAGDRVFVYGSLCCGGGKVSLSDPIMGGYEQLVKWWTAGDSSEDGKIGKVLRSCSRSINNALAMTSLKVSQPRAKNKGYEPSVVIQGKVTHFMPQLKRPVGADCAFAQLLVLDAALETTDVIDMHFARMSIPPGMSPADKHRVRQIIAYLRPKLHALNPYVQDFVSAMHENTGCMDDVQIVIDSKRRPVRDPHGHDRTYNDVEEYGGAHVQRPGSGFVYKEITVLLSDYTGDVDKSSLVIRQKESNKLFVVPQEHRSFDALHYVLLFPNGDDGWTREDGISMLQFYAYKLQSRPHRPWSQCLLSAGRLFQEYVCIAFAKVEQQRLDWHRYHQRTLRAELYQNVVDHYYDPTSSSQRMGRIILGSSFLGGPRSQHQRFLDSMAIVRDRGKPSLFITFTCNPFWPEIVSSIDTHQTPPDRPDVVARVFHAKFKELMHDLLDEHVLGPVSAHLAVIEFQKRGLPHAHILLILNSYARLHTVDHVDTVVSAEIPPIPDLPPDSEGYKRVVKLRTSVLTHMVHNDCTIVGVRCPCHNSDNLCKSHFPRVLSSATTWDDHDIYPQYRRRPIPTNSAKTPKGRVVNNAWITPYNPLLLYKYDCHLNVEVCVGRHGVKYLYKYVRKNTDHGDRAMAGVQNKGAEDEPTHYQDFRALGSSEAAWRLFQFEMHSCYPPVERLELHLHGKNMVRFVEGEEVAVAENAPTETKLTQWLKFVVACYRRQDLNADWKLVTNCTYVTWPSHFVWKHTDKKWVRRQQNLYDRSSVTVGRLVFINPKAGELFYLSVMLAHITVANIHAFMENRLLQGNHPAKHIRRAATRLGVNLLRLNAETFHEACIAHGFLFGMNEWRRIMDVASSTLSAATIRDIFLTLVEFNDVSDPLALLHEFGRAMSDFSETVYRDLLQRRPMRTLFGTIPPMSEDDWRYAIVVYALRNEAEAHSESEHLLNVLPDIPPLLLELLEYLSFLQSTPRMLREEMYNQELESHSFAHAYHMISAFESQKHIVDCVVTSISTATPLRLFIDAPGGTGKTFCLNAILNYVRGRGEIALAVASTGIAALLLRGGRTVHSRFKVPLQLDGQTTCNISVQTQLGDLVRAATLLVYDEAPMHHRYLLEALDRTLRDVRDDESPFGGLTIVMAGDFRQTLPIVRHSTRSQQVQSCMHQSELWDVFDVMRLTDNMRVHAIERYDPHRAQELGRFSQWLLSVGDGTINHTNLDSEGYVDISGFECYCGELTIARTQRLVDWAFPNLTVILQTSMGTPWDPPPIDFLSRSTILCSRHCVANKINDAATSLLQTETFVCQSANKVEDSYCVNTDYLASLEDPSVPPSLLTLKVNMPVMLMRNIRPQEGLCNGTRLMVVAVLNNAILEAIIISGHSSYIGSRVHIPRIKLYGDATLTSFEWSRLQLPVKPCWAMTINKAQGQTFDRVAVCLERECFSHGQFYVAASRLGDPANISFWIPKNTDPPMALNIVYPEALLPTTTEPLEVESRPISPV